MQLVVKGKNMEINDRLREFVEGKITRLERVLPNMAEAEVELSSTKAKSVDSRYAVQITLKVNGALIRGEQSAADAYSAMDAVLDKIDRQIVRYKTKKGAVQAKGKAALPMTEPEEEEEDEIEPAQEGQGRLVRVKRFAIKPMDAEEALEQMQLLGHDFFVFFNSDIDSVSVVYRRKDGNFGLIEPDNQ